MVVQLPVERAAAYCLSKDGAFIYRPSLGPSNPTREVARDGHHVCGKGSALTAGHLWAHPQARLPQQDLRSSVIISGMATTT